MISFTLAILVVAIASAALTAYFEILFLRTHDEWAAWMRSKWSVVCLTSTVITLALVVVMIVYFLNHETNLYDEINRRLTGAYSNS